MPGCRGALRGVDLFRLLSCRIIKSVKSCRRSPVLLWRVRIIMSLFWFENNNLNINCRELASDVSQFEIDLYNVTKNMRSRFISDVVLHNQSHMTIDNAAGDLKAFGSGLYIVSVVDNETQKLKNRYCFYKGSPYTVKITERIIREKKRRLIEVDSPVELPVGRLLLSASGMPFDFSFGETICAGKKAYFAVAYDEGVTVSYKIERPELDDDIETGDQTELSYGINIELKGS